MQVGLRHHNVGGKCGGPAKKRQGTVPVVQVRGQGVRRASACPAQGRHCVDDEWLQGCRVGCGIFLSVFILLICIIVLLGGPPVAAGQVSYLVRQPGGWSAVHPGLS